MWLSFESASGGSGGSPSPARDDRRTALLRRGAEGGYLRGSLAGHELRGGHEHKCGHRADSGNDPCKEQDLVETRKESLPCNRHQVWRDRTGKASERHSIGEPPRLIRGNPRDQLGDPALRPRQKERAHRRSSCRDPDLTKRVVDSRGDAALLLRDPNEYRIIEETLRSCRSARVARRDNDVGTENAEFRRQAALGVDLQIEESRGDGGARAERK